VCRFRRLFGGGEETAFHDGLPDRAAAAWNFARLQVRRQRILIAALADGDHRVEVGRNVQGGTRLIAVEAGHAVREKPLSDACGVRKRNLARYDSLRASRKRQGCSLEDEAAQRAAPKTLLKVSSFIGSGEKARGDQRFKKAASIVCSASR
jgi:hypothetical protein